MNRRGTDWIILKKHFNYFPSANDKNKVEQVFKIAWKGYEGFVIILFSAVEFYQKYLGIVYFFLNLRLKVTSFVLRFSMLTAIFVGLLIE